MLPVFTYQSSQSRWYLVELSGRAMSDRHTVTLNPWFRIGHDHYNHIVPSFLQMQNWLQQYSRAQTQTYYNGAVLLMYRIGDTTLCNVLYVLGLLT